jgi:transposase
MRVFKVAKESAVNASAQAKNQIKAVLFGVGPELRESLSELSAPALITRCADLPITANAAAFTLRLLAQCIPKLTAEVKGLTRRIDHDVRIQHPRLLDIVGVGPDGAAALLIAACGDTPSDWPTRSPPPRHMRRQPGQAVLQEKPGADG